jgi:predicted MFS family arabinose efflux permease
VLPIELLHGLTFACGWGAGCEKSKSLAPPGLEATQQGLFQALYFGLGYGTGSLIGGAIATHLGFQMMYIWGACIVTAGWILARLGRWVISINQFGCNVAYVPVRTSN